MPNKVWDITDMDKYSKDKCCIVTKTPTQQQLNLTQPKFGFYMKRTSHHHPPPPQKYLSCYWTDADKTLNVGSWDHLGLVKVS